MEYLPYTGNKKGWPWTEEKDPSIYSGVAALPKISIVTPSFNQGEYIEETIRSVLLQNYPNLEYIVIDGGSTDKTIEIIKKYAQWITYWVSEPDNGQSHALNKGVEKCTGEIFNWINSDDFYSQNALFSIAQAFRQSNGDVVAGYNNRFIEKNGQYITTTKVRLEICEELEQTLFFHSLRQASTFFKLDQIKLLHGLNAKLNYVMDTEMFIQYLLKFGQEKIKFIDTIIVNYRLQDKSKTVSAQDMFLKEISDVYSILAKEARNENRKYDISLLNPDKVLSYFYALQAFNTPRKQIFSYLRWLYKSYVYYPKLSSRHFMFLMKNIIFYKKEKNDFQ